MKAMVAGFSPRTRRRANLRQHVSMSAGDGEMAASGTAGVIANDAECRRWRAPCQAIGQGSAASTPISPGPSRNQTAPSRHRHQQT